MKRFYFACPKCSGTAMSGTDIYEGRTLKCSCGNVIKVDLGELVLTECDSCKKNNAFYLKNGKEQNCLSCGKMLKIRPPQKILDQEDLALFEQFVEIVNKGIMTKVKVEKAQGIFNKIQKKDQLAGYANHIRNCSEFIMFDSEYNSAVRAMNEASKKLEQALQYKTKDELSQLELAFSGAAKRFAMLGGFKKVVSIKKPAKVRLLPVILKLKSCTAKNLLRLQLHPIQKAVLLLRLSKGTPMFPLRRHSRKALIRQFRRHMILLRKRVQAVKLYSSELQWLYFLS